MGCWLNFKGFRRAVSESELRSIFGSDVQSVILNHGSNDACVEFQTAASAQMAFEQCCKRQHTLFGTTRIWYDKVLPLDNIKQNMTQLAIAL